jgi:hypothetical protein
MHGQRRAKSRQAFRRHITQTLENAPAVRLVQYERGAVPGRLELFHSLTMIGFDRPLLKMQVKSGR